MKSNRNVIGYALIVAMGGFLFGLDTAVISGAEKAIQQLYHLSNAWHGFTVAVALIGTVVGSFSAGWPSEIYGRKKVLLFIAFLYGLSALGCAFAPSWLVLVTSRFLGGLAIGASSVIGPMYIAEIAPAHIRGRLVALFQFNVVFGIFLAFLSNYLLAGIGENAWRWMLGIVAAPAFLFFGLIFLIPDSPRWLVKHNLIARAKEVLALCGRVDIDGEINDIVESLNIHADSPAESLFSKKYSRPILYAVLLAAFNQLSGINAIMYYAPEIFKSTGDASGSALMQTVLVGIINVLFTLVAIKYVDRWGRRTLLLIGCAGMAVCLAIVGAAFYFGFAKGYLVLIAILAYIAFFAISLGPLAFVVIAEIFSNRNRGMAMSVCIFFLWASVYAVSQSFPMLLASIGSAFTFWIYMLMSVFAFLFVYKLIPETKGKSLEEIEHYWIPAQKVKQPLQLHAK